VIWKDRYEAARRLVPYLENFKDQNAVIMAVPRGGVPIGNYLAKNLEMPMDLLLVKKIGHPMNKEVAIGAVSLEDYMLDSRFKVSSSYIEMEVQRIRQALNESYNKFMGGREPMDLHDKTVIIVDDGIATGQTLLAAIRLIRKRQPRKVVVAVPVAPEETVRQMRKHTDDFICLHIPVGFLGVSAYFKDFTQVDDSEVQKLVDEINPDSSNLTKQTQV
jgi:putative phosphoribosyl transferase